MLSQFASRAFTGSRKERPFYLGQRKSLPARAIALQRSRAGLEIAPAGSSITLSLLRTRTPRRSRVGANIKLKHFCVWHTFLRRLSIPGLIRQQRRPASRSHLRPVSDLAQTLSATSSVFALLEISRCEWQAAQSCAHG